MTNYTMRPLLYSERAQQAVQDQTMEDLASKLVKRWGQTDFRKLEPLVERRGDFLLHLDWSHRRR